MVAMAAPGSTLPLRGGFLPALDAASLDALHFVCVAARLRLRRNARSAGKQALPGRAVDARHGGLSAGTDSGGLLLRARVSSCGAHRAVGALQRGKRCLRLLG